jgi:two-component system, sensor histidine kinase and response regulator
MEPTISDLIDVSKFTRLCDSLYENIHLSVLLIDKKGDAVVRSGLRKSDVDFSSVLSLASETCPFCSSLLKALPPKNFDISFLCKNGLHAIQLTIKYREKNYGILIIGPFAIENDIQSLECLPKAIQNLIPLFTNDELPKKFELFEIMLNDIMERKAIRDSVTLEQVFMRALMTNIPDAIYFKDKKSRFLKASDAKAHKHGFSNPNDIVGKTDFDLFGEKHAQRAFESEQRILQTGDSIISLEEMEQLKDNSNRWVSSTKMPLFDKSGNIIGTFGISRDITKRKLAELEIQKMNYELKELNATKDRFFSIIAHDLKSPFTALLGISELLTDPQTDLNDDESREMIAQLRELLNKEYELLQNLLDWSCLQLGRMDFHPAGLNLLRISSGVMNLLSNNAKNKEITIVNSIDPNVFVSADINMLKSIFQNLLSNSIKFTNNCGTIILSAKVNSHYVAVHVKDNGIGMSDKSLTKLHTLDENFTTLGTNGEKGTGLGVMLCKEMIEKHGGAMNIQSKLNNGTEVIFTIPKLQ